MAGGWTRDGAVLDQIEDTGAHKVGEVIADHLDSIGVHPSNAGVRIENNDGFG